MLELCSVTKRYRKKTALEEVSLVLSQGVYGLLGPNGAGKTTLMNLICCNLRPDGGEILWDGKEIRSLGASYRSLLGYAPQQQGMYDAFSGRRFLSYMAALKGIPGSLVRPEVERVLAATAMTEAADRAIGGCSGGMKQRLLLAQALLGDPKLLVLDEPTAGLDPRERVRLREYLHTLAEERIILFSTHVVADLAPIAGEILLLRSGRLADRGTTGELCRKYGTDSLEGVYLHVFGEENRDDPSAAL